MLFSPPEVLRLCTLAEKMSLPNLQVPLTQPTLLEAFSGLSPVWPEALGTASPVAPAVRCSLLRRLAAFPTPLREELLRPDSLLAGELLMSGIKLGNTSKKNPK